MVVVVDVVVDVVAAALESPRPRVEVVGDNSDHDHQAAREGTRNARSA